MHKPAEFNHQADALIDQDTPRFYSIHEYEVGSDFAAPDDSDDLYEKLQEEYGGEQDDYPYFVRDEYILWRNN